MGAADNQVGAGEMTEERATPGRGSRLSDMSRFLFQKRERSPQGVTTGRPNGLEMSRVAVGRGEPQHGKRI